MLNDENPEKSAVRGESDGLVVLSDDEPDHWIFAADSRLVREETWSRELAVGKTTAAVF